MWSWLLHHLRERQRKQGRDKHELASLAAKVLGVSGGVLVLAAILAARRTAAGSAKRPAQIALSAVLRLLRENRVQELTYSDGGALMLLLKPEKAAVAGAIKARRSFLSQLVPGSEEHLFKAADEALVRTRYMAPSKGLSQVFSFLLPLAFLFAWYRVAKSLISRDEKFTPTRSRLPIESTTFADVVSRSKVELSEIVDYLNNPGRYMKAGARLPRGALLVGPSGTGKTLLARAVAGEANCRFLSASASEFVEVYVGRGAARIRDLFKQARALAPVVLFLDELDALGTRSRGSTSVGGGEEYVQTLNQLLTELDGFHGHSDGVVILGATNRQEAIDPALLRPGRFDRFVQVELPDEEERLEILQIHAEKAEVAKELKAGTLQTIAAASTGFSGAELANVVNEAIFLALRSGRKRPLPEDFSLALERRKAARKLGGCTTAAGDVAGGFSRALRVWPKAAVA
eukprot:TRINITY_DN108858_c0_g1_i1.p1 TRINITY_DN108858_c0_g1~~TRINITY_DN108858_c0_g1_i1.p1  ORF type:complete len:460 (-),score=115.28 TRINITY_DN108858_c0_g1_i1:65-1444(-)